MKNQDLLHTKSIYDVIVIGGGLAGLTNAIHLSGKGIKVLVIEKNSYPKHKVCGEYVSNEVLPYLEALGIHPKNLGAVFIDQFEMSTQKGKLLKSKLPLGGFGISRYAFDLELAEKAKSNGADIIQDVVTGIEFADEKFCVQTRSNRQFVSKIAIGAFGKRSFLDKKLNRKFIKNRSPYLAVKMHAEGSFQDNLVALHNFNGGYCGVSMVENKTINLCYITNSRSFRKFRNIDEFQQKVLYRNKHLKKIFANVRPVFKDPITISQISFAPKLPVENHLLMCGDTAGLIHPLCGNGMGMAIRSAQFASKLIIKFFNGELKDRKSLESMYAKAWKKEFHTRLKVGGIIANLIKHEWLTEHLAIFIRAFPSLLPRIISLTHGKTMVTG